MTDKYPWADTTHTEIIEESSRPRQRIAELETQLAVAHVERARITYLVAKAAIKLFDGEFIGQRPGPLWDWAVTKAMHEDIGRLIDEGEHECDGIHVVNIKRIKE